MGQIAFCLHLHDGQIDWNWFQIDLKVSCEQGAILKKKTSLLPVISSLNIFPEPNNSGIAKNFNSLQILSGSRHGFLQNLYPLECVIDSFHDKTYIHKTTGIM